MAEDEFLILYILRAKTFCVHMNAVHTLIIINRLKVIFRLKCLYWGLWEMNWYRHPM